MARQTSDDAYPSEEDRPFYAPRPNIGRQSIEAIIRDAERDAEATRKSYEALKDLVANRPESSMTFLPWSQRFERFRESELHQSADQLFKVEDLVQFLDVTIDDLRATVPGKLIPSERVLQDVAEVIQSYGHWKWDDGQFHPGRWFAIRLWRFFQDQLIFDRLAQGFWQEKVWRSYATLSRIVHSLIQHAIDHGTMSWDVVMSRALSVTLISQLGLYNDDIALAFRDDNAQTLRWRDIVIYLPAGDDNTSQLPRFIDLRAKLTADFGKDYNDHRRRNQVKDFQPLIDARNSHVCPISLILVQALRQGLIVGEPQTVDDVIVHMSGQADRRIKWSSPDHPVFAAIHSNEAGETVLLHKQANEEQLDRSLEQMCIIFHGAGSEDHANTDTASLSEYDRSQFTASEPETLRLKESILCGLDVTQFAPPSPRPTPKTISEPVDRVSRRPPKDIHAQEIAELLCDRNITTNDIPSSSSGADWVNIMAKINTVAHTRFADLWNEHCPDGNRPDDFDSIFATTCQIGHSRDLPEPFRYSCSKAPCCDYATIIKESILDHEKSCLTEAISADNQANPTAGEQRKRKSPDESVTRAKKQRSE